jgi:nucleotide-binding universal stress UspA family protein
MLRIRKILFPTDFSRCSRQALIHALFLAEQHDAELQLLHAVILHADDPAAPKLRFPQPRDIFDRLQKIAESEMAELARAHRGRPIRITEFRERGFSAAQVILDHLTEHEIDLVVMGTHGRRGPARLFFGSVAEEVVRFARVPVLTLREIKRPRQIEAFERILVPIDFSPHSERSVAYARELALTYGAALELVHVIEQPSYPYFYAPFVGGGLGGRLPEIQSRAGEALHELMANGDGPEVEYGVHILDGRPSAEIVAFADSQAIDMIVVATHGLTGLERLLVGSTAEQVVRTASTPVFLIKSFGKSLLANERPLNVAESSARPTSPAHP